MRRRGARSRRRAAGSYGTGWNATAFLRLHLSCFGVVLHRFRKPRPRSCSSPHLRSPPSPSPLPSHYPPPQAQPSALPSPLYLLNPPPSTLPMTLAHCLLITGPPSTGRLTAAKGIGSSTLDSRHNTQLQPRPSPQAQPSPRIPLFTRPNVPLPSDPRYPLTLTTLTHCPLITGPSSTGRLTDAAGWGQQHFT